MATFWQESTTAIQMKSAFDHHFSHRSSSKTTVYAPELHLLYLIQQDERKETTVMVHPGGTKHLFGKLTPYLLPTTIASTMDEQWKITPTTTECSTRAMVDITPSA